LFSYDKYVIKDNNFSLNDCPYDTVPGKDYKGSMKMKDFDKLQSELDKSLLQVNEEMKKIDLSAMQKEIEASLKAVDMEKIMKDVESSLKSIDLEKMMADISSSLKDVNLELKSSEIEKAMQEAKKEIEKAKLEIKEVDREAIKKELEKAKLEIDKIKPEIDKIDMDKIINEARAGIDKAKEELKLTREMFTEMEKDGLINSKEGFTVEYKDKSLYIDGKKQSEKITDKYRKYFKQEHFKMKIDKD
jgi:Asp-tRNA(Asn)/Glu-tRNA(Gln) amidotransferase A subunit family amidase